MILTGPEILEEMARGNIAIEPFDPKYVNPNSVNLTLFGSLLVYRRPSAFKRFLLWLIGKPWCLDMAKKNEVDTIEIPPEGYVLQPGILYLGSTRETTTTLKHAPMLEGRSSVARLGLTIHLTAGWGDTGFRAPWTTEMTVVYPLRVYAGVPICQIGYSEVRGELMPYRGKYQGQKGPQPGKLYEDFNDSAKVS